MPYSVTTAASSPPQAGASSRKPGTLSNELLIIDGMFCGGCAATVEHRLASVPGVEDVAVDLAAGAALLQWQPGRENPDAACALIASLGYSARKPDAAPPQNQKDPGRSLQLSLVLALFFGMWTMLPSIALYLDAAPTEAIAHGLAWAAAIASLPVIAFSGRHFYVMAFATLRSGAAGIDALVALGVLGAVVLSAVSLAQGGSEVYFEVAVALITLQLIARLIQRNMARKARDGVARLLDLAPPRAVRLDKQGRAERVAVADIVPGDLVIVEAGESVAVDGSVDGGDVLLDRRLLTGESEAVRVQPGDHVFAGEIVAQGPLRIRVTASAGERRIDALSNQVRTMLMHKPDWQRSVDVIARHFLVLAAVASAAGAILAMIAGEDIIGIAERALAVFVIACPCALSLAAPLAGLGASRRAVDAGILLRDLRVLTRAGKVDALFVDKTGTLTLGRPTLRALHPVAGVNDEELLAVAAFVESESRHPLAVAIVNAAIAADIRFDEESLFGPVSGPRENRTVVGAGIQVNVAGTTLRVGSADWLVREGGTCPPLDDNGFSRVWVARGDRVLGAIDLDDTLRPGARAAIEVLQGSGISLTILSGDAEAPVIRLARELGISGVARCSPEDKVAHIESAAAAGKVTAFVGDGLNDGPAIAAADLGIAVEDAVDAARTASAATLVRGGVERVPALLSLVSAAGRVMQQNIIWAILYNAIAVPAALIGWVHPAVAAVAMAASSLSIVLNSSRTYATPAGESSGEAAITRNRATH